ncbi:Ppx/GppA phosphatase family protein [Acidomonas methanolica]|uniref:Ppx/GppA phosphatase family protein n=1 Tax=Acidomonas methanolica TaxID=437 RepID=UPI00211A27DA|nr:Ppx/GppA phosphatase family protein [Acidomonas methanolica]MCQ9154668.1 Ppx/GppA family phosphatase [Acidomonas methanolica]
MSQKRSRDHAPEVKTVLRGEGGVYFAAIDLGTNNCRLMIAGGRSGSMRVVDNFNRSIRLGEGLHHTGALSEAAMQRAVDALHACAARMRHWSLRAIRGVATEACRRASNGEAFLRRVREETGLTLEIISPREEAELAMESCTSLLYANNHRRRRAVLFDIGGGSTEIAWLHLDPFTRVHELVGTVSIPWGVITMAEHFVAPDPDAPEEVHAAQYDAMVRFVTQQLQAFGRLHNIDEEVRQRNVAMLGTSGTITTLAGIALGLERYNRHVIDGVTLTDAASLEAIDILRGLGMRGLMVHPCVGTERATYVLPGCAIFEAIHRLWPVDAITVADRGLRDGLLTRMAREARVTMLPSSTSSRHGGDMAHPAPFRL